MGMVLDAGCGCGYAEAGLRLGTTHEAIALHDVETSELFRATCCKRVVSARVLLGMPLPSPPCPGCEQPLPLSLEKRYAVARLSGETLTGHPCPACGESESLSFTVADTFV